MKPRSRSTRLRAGMFVLGLALSVPIFAAPAPRRESLGTFAGWGAFRDSAGGRRCFAIAEPVRRGGEAGRAFMAIGFWPAQGFRGQVQLRLSRRKARGAPVVLTAGTRRFTLIAGGNAAWARDPRADAAILAAMRGATSLSVEGTARNGRPFVDAYALRGAPTAIDAAALGCAGR